MHRAKPRRYLAGLLASGVVVSGLVTAPAASAASGASPGIDWGPCDDKVLAQAGAQCGFVEVPLDYSNPDGEQIKLRVSRIQHTVPDSQYQGVMLVNPGGPGGSGLRMPLISSQVPKNAGAYYDWIGFDPRGVGRSEPRLSCLPFYAGYDRPQYVPSKPGVERIWKKRSQAYANECSETESDLLANMRTTDSARDMNQIRKALGAEKINYYGFSYGTYLGQVYATMFPDRVRRMVLDSNVNPEKVWYELNLRQDVAFGRNAQIWFDWLAKYNEVFHLGDSGAEVSELFFNTRRKLNEHAAGGLIGGAEWTDIFLTVGYSQFAWESLGHLFANYVHTGKWKPLVEAYTPSDWDDNSYAVYLAVECTDAPWPSDWSTWRQDNWRIHGKAPFETWGNAWYNAPCFYWQQDAGKPVEIDGSEAPPILLIGGTLDAATPYKGSLTVREKFPKSRLIAMVGEETHAASLRGNKCVDNRIADYLLTGKLPPRIPAPNTADVLCSEIPDPVPTAGDAPQQRSVTQKLLARASTPVPT